MKKIFYTGLAIFAIGLVLLGTLFATGKFDITSLSNMDHDIPFFSFNLGFLYDNHYEEYNETFTDIKEIHVSGDIAEVEYLVSYDDKFHVEAKLYNNDQIIVNTQTLGNLSIHLSNGRSISRHKVSIIKIYIPKDVVVDVVDIQNSMAEIKISNIKTNYLKINSSMASVTIKQAEVNQLEVDMSMVDFYFNGLIHERAHITNDMGNIELRLDNDESEVGYYVENSMGNVVVGNKKHTGFNGSMHENEHAPVFLEIKNSMGNIEIYF